ncbi:uncharacterized protein LOC111088557 [Limulus polyphemus]|uniref:Uncharacterized protein LOC111088557 n=1 Tax=Limulus polyphemus TaxID=6850 RepID=A0ABM1TFU0_LIMPO|nr:uncharacterized protein LOC111088557 [Limulus polyphemus]
MIHVKRNDPCTKVLKLILYLSSFDILVIDERNRVLMGQSSKVIRTKEIHLVASTRMKVLILGYKKSFCLNGSYSYDPSKENTSMYYQWMCFLNNGSPCYITQDDGGMLRLEQVIGDAVHSPVLCIKDGLPLPQDYNFTLLVKKDTRSAFTSVHVKVIDTDDDTALSIINKPYLNNLVNPNRDLNVYYLVNGSIIAEYNCPSIIQGFYCIDFRYMTHYLHDFFGDLYYVFIPADRMSARRSYFILFKSLDKLFSNGAHVLTFTTAADPFIGTLKVIPSEDSALMTDFTLDASEGWWTSIDRYPLTYQFFYVIYGMSTHFHIETDISVLTGVARNVTLPCNTKEVILKVCDVNDLCSNATQPVDVQCTKLETFQDISSFDKLFMNGYCHRTWSLIEDLKKALIEMDALQLVNTVMKETEYCFLKSIEQYQNILDLHDEKEEQESQVMNVLPRDNFTDYMKVELLGFKDSVFWSFEKMKSEKYEEGQRVSRLPTQMVISLIEELMHQLQWDLGDTDKRIEAGVVQVPGDDKLDVQHWRFWFRASFSYLSESTVHYSRDAENYLVSAVWKSMITDRQLDDFQEGVEYEIQWHFNDSHEIRAAGLLQNDSIISRGSCKTLPLSIVGSIFHLEPFFSLSIFSFGNFASFNWAAMAYKNDFYVSAYFIFETDCFHFL